MNYNYHYEQIRTLNDLLKNSYKRFERHIDKEVVELDLTWDAARFWANMIYKSQPFNDQFTLSDLKIFQADHENRNNVKIDLDQLFAKFWLRNILGAVEIAGNVSYACRYTFEKIKNRKEELIFLNNVYPQIKQAKRKLSRTDFESLISGYNQSYNTTVEIKSMLEGNPHWATEKDGLIEFSDFEYHYQPFLDHWDDFEFIKDLLEQNKRNERGLIINKIDFENIHESFSSFFPLTPSIKLLKKQQVITYRNSKYYINFFDSDTKYWSGLDDKITGFFWELLITDNTFDSDNDRVIHFLSQISYYESSPDPLLFVKETSKKRFLDAAFQLILKEEDLDYVTNEFHKVSIDSHYARSLEFFHLEKLEHYSDYSLNLNDPFELYESFDEWEERARITYLHNQHSRNKLESLIRLIVKHDYEIERIETENEDNPIIERYKRIISLLESYQEKPILLHYLSSYIVMYRREIFPLLLLDEKFTSFSFKLIDKFKFEDSDQAVLSKKIWAESIGIALITIRSVQDQKELAAKMICQIFRQLNTEKYIIPFNRNPRQEGIINNEKQRKEKLILSLIEDALIQDQKTRRANGEYLIPSIFNELFQQFSNLKIKSLYHNGTTQFPMLQMDGLVWLMRCSTYWKYKDQFNKLNPEILLLTRTFFDLYMTKLEMTEIKKWDFIDNTEKQAIPHWSEKVERLQYIEWIYPIYLFSKHQKLNSFLEPRLSFETAENRYHEMNRFTSDKLRTHIGVLIQVLQKLISSGIPNGFDKKELENIKVRIEKQIIDYVKSHTKDIPKEGKIDLLEYQKEVGFQNSEKEALLPQIARSINWFTDKEGIIDAIIDSDDIIKILIVAELITSHGIKQTLIEKIKTADLQAFLEGSYWIPEIHTVLLKVTAYPQLMDQIIQITNYWEGKIATKEKKYKDQLYKTQLLIAYYHKDELELNSVKLPKKKGYIEVNALTYHDYRDFYRALIRLNDNPENSYEIFNRLASDFPTYPVFALNRMAAKMKIVDQKSDTSLYAEILDEWDVYEKANPDIDVMELGEHFFINKSIILLKLEKYDQLDKEYNALDLSYRMLPGLLETKTERLIAEKKIGEALMLLDHAEMYHQYSSITEIEFIRDLKNKIQGIDDVEELRFHYNRIFQSNPKKLISIFPDKLNGKSDVIEFVTNELALSVNRMLDKVHSVADIKKEDKFNDLVHLALESRIAPWGWSVKDQTRRAFSPTEKDLGEIDLDIQDWNKKSFVTCEAFILRDTPRVQSHLEKLIAHYTHDRKAFLILVYCLHPNTKFQQKWEEYSKTIVPNLNFPSGYEISSNEVKDLSKEFGYDKSAIKIGRSIHGTDTPMYHVFVNIKYKIP